MRSWLASILLLMVSAPLLAQTAAKPETSTTTTTTTTTAKPKAKKPAATAKKPMVTTATEIKTLRDAVSAQQQQIQMLRDELARRDAAMQQVQQQVNALQSLAPKVQAAEACCKDNGDALAALKTNIASVQTTATATANSLQAAEKKIIALESPASIKYKGITLTPGGFISANVNWRNHNQNLDNFGGFNALPFNGSSNAHLSELRLTGRYSRLSLLAQGKFGRSNVQAYYEMDFEGAAQTGNEVTTNSFQPRIRELWANVDAPGGVSFSGGQTWSLITANRVGVGPRGIMLPSHISASLVVGWHYTRQAGFRVYKTWDLANKRKLYFAFAAENPEVSVAGSAPAGFTIWGTPGAAVVSLGGGTTCTATTPCSTFASNVSVDGAPDLIGKVAFEPGWGHYELGILGRFFRDRVALTANAGIASSGTNHTTPGAALSFNAVLPVVAKKVDIVVTTLGGRGIGRYSPNTTDVTIRPDGTLQPLLGYSGAVGIETHPNPKWDFLIYVGDEYMQRSPYYTAFSAGTATIPVGFPTAGVGYGTINSIQSGCQVEIPLAGQACGVSNRNLMEISPGFWYRFYKGPAGTIQYGMFYSYQRRAVWTGNQNTAAVPVLGAPLGEQHEILTAFRWYFP